jgi:NADH-quinone oxidoreductase subunit J
MSLTQIVFYFLAVLSIGSAVLMITRRNPVHSILWLIVVFFTISGNYVLLNAQFLAIVNIIVYAGAIMVLFLVMLMNLNADSEPVKNQRLLFAGFISGGCLMLVIIMALMKVESQAVELNTGSMGLVKELGKQLFTSYVVPFEISSVLFLSAMIGAVVIGKKD